jgi:GH24 family phage-related lysozyme (muramidase)
VAETDEQKKREEETTTVPAGYALALPGVDLAGFILPKTNIVFDPPPVSVKKALDDHSAPQISWPITGTIAHVKSAKFPCTLNWVVAPEGASEIVTSAHPSRTTFEPGKKPTVKMGSAYIEIDGSGAFKVQVKVNDKVSDPVLCLAAAGVLGSGKVGFNLFLTEFPRARPVALATDLMVPYKDIHCAVQMVPYKDDRCKTAYGEAEKACLGDRAKLSGTAPPPFNKSVLRLKVDEVDDDDASVLRSTTEAWTSVLSPGAAVERVWSIGFRDQACNAFYTEDEEAGDFEYLARLQAKSELTGEFHDLAVGKKAMSVTKPELVEFSLDGPWEDGRTYTARGKMRGVGAKLDLRVDVAVASPFAIECTTGRDPVQRAQMGATRTFKVIPTDDPQIWKFFGDLEGVDVGPPRMHVAQPDALKVSIPFSDRAPEPLRSEEPRRRSTHPIPFAVLTLPLHKRRVQGVAVPGPIAAFLGFDEGKFARYMPDQGLTWDPTAAWVCSQEWRDSGVPRPPRPRVEYGQFRAPGPDAGGDQRSQLTTAEILADLKGWEGVVGYMYKDSRGFVTVGIGTRVTVGETAQGQKLKDAVFDWHWVNMRTGGNTDERLDRSVIQQAYDRVLKMAPALGAAKYWQEPSIELPMSEMERLVKDEIDKCVASARTAFPDGRYDSFPKCVRRLVIDIMYNAGAGALLPDTPKTWKDLRRSLLAGDWQGGVKHVAPPRGARGDWRRSLLTYAQRLTSP